MNTSYYYLHRLYERMQFQKCTLLRDNEWIMSTILANFYSGSSGKKTQNMLITAFLLMISFHKIISCNSYIIELCPSLQYASYTYYNLYFHYCDVIMSMMASQISGVSIVYSTVCLDADQIKHQSPASLAFVRGIHQWPVNSLHKGPVTRKMFPFDDIIMLCAKPSKEILLFT